MLVIMMKNRINKDMFIAKRQYWENSIRRLINWLNLLIILLFSQRYNLFFNALINWLKKYKKSDSQRLSLNGLNVQLNCAALTVNNIINWGIKYHGIQPCKDWKVSLWI